MSYIEIVAKRLKEKRLERGLTLEEVSERINITPVTLHKYENMKVSNVPIDKIEQLALIYNTTPTYLVGWTDDDLSKGRAKTPTRYIDIYNNYLKITNAKDRLISIREKNDFSKNEFALALGITIDELYEYENGIKEITLNMIERLELWFSIPKEVWLMGDGISQTTKDYISNLVEKQKQEIEIFIFDTMIDILRKDGYKVDVRYQNTPQEYWRISSFYLPVDVLNIQRDDLLELMMSSKNIFIDLLKSYASGYLRHNLIRTYRTIGG